MSAGYALLFQDAVQYGVVACGLLLSLGVSHSVAHLREERVRAASPTIPANGRDAIPEAAIGTRLKEELISFIDAWPHPPHYEVEHTDATSPAHTLDFDYLKTTCGLTERQVQVLNLVLRGHTDRQIAAMLSISTRTVGYHVSAILHLVGMERRTRLRHELLETREGEG